MYLLLSVATHTAGAGVSTTRAASALAVYKTFPGTPVTVSAGIDWEDLIQNPDADYAVPPDD